MLGNRANSEGAKTRRFVGQIGAIAFRVDDLFTRLPRVGPPPFGPATVQPWAALANPFRIGWGGSELGQQIPPGPRDGGAGKRIAGWEALRDDYCRVQGGGVGFEDLHRVTAAGPRLKGGARELARGGKNRSGRAAAAGRCRGRAIRPNSRATSLSRV